VVGGMIKKDQEENGKKSREERSPSEAPSEARSEGGWEEKYKRARADYINLERRTKEQQAEFLKFANSVLILKLLPVLDDLEKAVQKSKDSGLNLVLKNLQEVLKSEGVEEMRIEVGDEFDPRTMEGVATAEGTEESAEAQKVNEVLRKGYRMKEKVLRPVQVRVRS